MRSTASLTTRLRTRCRVDILASSSNKCNMVDSNSTTSPSNKWITRTPTKEGTTVSRSAASKFALSCRPFGSLGAIYTRATFERAGQSTWIDTRCLFWIVLWKETPHISLMRCYLSIVNKDMQQVQTVYRRSRRRQADQLVYCKNHFGTSGPQTARDSSPAAPQPTGVSLFTKSPSA